MKSIRFIAVMLCLLSAAAAQAQWTNVFGTDYDSASYVLGNSINGVDGWVTASSSYSAQSTIQKEPSPSTNQFNYIGGANTFSTYRQLPATYGAGTLIKLSYTWSMLTSDVQSNNESYGLWTMLTGTTDPATARTGMIGANYDKNTGVGTFKAFGFSQNWLPFGTFTLNSKYELSMVVNMTDKKYDVYLNGQKKLSGLRFYTSTQSTASYLQFYRRYQAGTFAIDNVSVDIAPVPEPSSLAALAGGLFGMFGLLRRRRI